MQREDLLTALFPLGHRVAGEAPFFAGTGTTKGGEITVIGTTDAAPIGVELALAIAAEVLKTVREAPGHPILLLIDTSGQRLSRRDELLGVNAYMAHVAKCLELARSRGHRILGLVHGEAVSGGFLASSLLADSCYALESAEVRVMNLPAMSRITKIPLATLESLSKTSPVFAPGVANYHAMGAIRGIWSGDLAAHLETALGEVPGEDRRAQDGASRGGRKLAQNVAARVRHDSL